jgi:hypothetical protein
LPLMNPDGFVNDTRTNNNGQDLNRSFPELGGTANPVNPYDTVKPSLQTLEAALPKDKKGNCAVPEVKAMMDWSDPGQNAGRHFVLAANFHTGNVVVNYPFDYDGSLTPHYAKAPGNDDALYQTLSKIYASNDPYIMANSPYTDGIVNGSYWKPITGGMQDFDYRYFGTKHVTIELYAGYDYGTKKAPLDVSQQWIYNKPAMLAYVEQGIPLVVPGWTYTASTPLAAQPAAVATTTQQPALSQDVLAALSVSVSQQTAKKKQSSLLNDDATADDREWSPSAVDMVLAGA